MSKHSVKQIGVFAKEAKPQPIYSCLCGVLLYGEEELKEHADRFPEATLQSDSETTVTDRFDRAKLNRAPTEDDE